MINDDGLELRDLDLARLKPILLVNQLARFMYTNSSIYEYFENHIQYNNNIVKCGCTHGNLQRQEHIISDAK